MHLLGYANKLSVLPGDQIQFMVSCPFPSYDAAIVRLDRAFVTREGGYEDTVVPSAVAGSHRGRVQRARPGSYVVVPDAAAGRLEDGVTIQAWIWPTLPARDREQGLIARWSAEEDAGFALSLDPSGRLMFTAGLAGEGARSVVIDVGLEARWWYFVAATYDARSGKLRLVCDALNRGWMHGERATARSAGASSRLAAVDGPLLIGALSEEKDERGRPFGVGYFNGKIDRPRLWSRALTGDEIAALRQGGDSREVGEGLIAVWDFAREIGTSVVHDGSGNGLDGRTVNMPTRGVTGANWIGDVHSVQMAPEQYGAIHFHEDDLADAGWEVDFAFDVPADLPSGIYAARLTSGEAAEYIPFFVRPRPGEAAAIAYLAPTNTYLAYANERLFARPDIEMGKMTDVEIREWPWQRVLLNHPELGASVYDLHVDGSGVCYSSRLRPIVTMRPDFISYNTACPRHFAADLFLIEWFARKGFAHDVITDEDLHVDGRELLAPYKVVLTGSHPEYWTGPMMDAVEGYLAGGGRVMYLGGNGFYWVTAIDPARPEVIEVRRGNSGTRSWDSAPGEGDLSLTGEPGGLWRHRGRPPNRLTGVGFTAEGWGGAAGYRRLPDSFDRRVAFIFDGIGDDEVIGDFGLVLNGAAGDEIDRFDLALGTPPETFCLATSAGSHTDYYQLVVEDCLLMVPGLGGTEHADVRADMTYLEGPGGGAVFSAGSINWCGSLPHNDFDNNVSRITENVLRRFLVGEG